jgi:hypothetical protein
MNGMMHLTQNALLLNKGAVVRQMLRPNLWVNITTGLRYDKITTILVAEVRFWVR